MTGEPVWPIEERPVEPSTVPGEESSRTQPFVTKPPAFKTNMLYIYSVKAVTAFDLNKGDIVWRITHGETPDNIRNNPALKGITIPRTGRPGRIGVLTTKSLVIAGEGGFFTTPNGQRGSMLRAYDKATSSEVARSIFQLL